MHLSRRFKRKRPPAFLPVLLFLIPGLLALFAGAVFAAEILYSEPEFESEVIIPAAISTIIAYCVFSFYFGFGSLFETPPLEFHGAIELVPYTVLALVVALAGGLFTTLFYRTHDFFHGLGIPAPLRPMIGGLAGTLIVLPLLLRLVDRGRWT